MAEKHKHFIVSWNPWARPISRPAIPLPLPQSPRANFPPRDLGFQIQEWQKPRPISDMSRSSGILSGEPTNWLCPAVQ